MGSTTKGVPFPDDTDFVGGGNEAIQAVAEWLDATPGISVMTTAARNALAGATRWTGRTVFVTDAAAGERLQTWDGAAWQKATFGGPYLPTAGGTMLGDIAMSGTRKITQPIIKAYREEKVELGSGGGSIALDLSVANYFVRTAVNTGLIVAITNVPSSTYAASFAFLLGTIGTPTITWPSTFRWPGGVAPSLPAGNHRINADTPDGGVNWYPTYSMSHA